MSYLKKSIKSKIIYVKSDPARQGSRFIRRATFEIFVDTWEMGSNYNGEKELAASSRKGKNKKSGSEKPKQPQRGLGVAQLEKIRLHAQMEMGGDFIPAPNTFRPFTNPIQMGLGDLGRPNMGHGDSQPTTNNTASRWTAENTILNPHYYQQPSITRNLIDLELEAEESVEKKKNGQIGDSMGSGSQRSGSSGSQELDLELRLSL
nr:PREDICTED: protein SPEAR1-like isoform X1 [Daucus carota subsp. sativus]